MEGSWRDLIVVLSQNFPGKTEINYETPQLGQSVS
jgi:hypothetical protein